MFVTAVLCLIVSLIIAAWLWNKRSNTFFKKLNVPYIPAPLLGGHLKDMFFQRKAITDVIMEIYNDPETKHEPVVGIRFLHVHGLVIRDLELIKRILVKDFPNFQDRRTNSDVKTDVLGGANMFMAKNPFWKTIRAKITPVFSSIKIRQFVKLIGAVGDDLHTYLEENVPDEKVLNVKEIAALYTTDVIATCAYGVQANSLTNPNSDFRRHGKNIFDFNTKRAVEFMMLFFWPEIVPYFKLKLFSKESTKFLNDTLVYVMTERQANKIVRNDLIDVLIGLRKNNESSEKAKPGESDNTFDDILLVAQAAVFFTAGFETTSSAIGFTLYELAKQPDLQQRLRKDIQEFLRLNNNEITYENLNQLTYLDMCCQETFRMYPSLPYIDRECTPENGGEFYSLEPISDFQVPRGFPIYIPTYALHRDEKYFPNPSKYDPERFNKENKDSIPPYAYIPFGMGPRNCLGERFGILQVKLGLIHFLKSHYVEVCAETQMNIQIHKLAMLVTPEAGLTLRIRKEKESGF